MKPPTSPPWIDILLAKYTTSSKGENTALPVKQTPKTRPPKIPLRNVNNFIKNIFATRFILKLILKFICLHSRFSQHISNRPLINKINHTNKLAIANHFYQENQPMATGSMVSKVHIPLTPALWVYIESSALCGMSNNIHHLTCLSTLQSPTQSLFTFI